MASNTKVSIEDFSDSIADFLNSYSEEVIEATEKAVDKTSKQALKTVREKSPGKGRYKKGWKRKINKNIRKAGQVSATVYNSKFGSIVHTVENGHQKENGGRVEGISHIRPAEEEAIRLFPALVKQEIEGIDV